MYASDTKDSLVWQYKSINIYSINLYQKKNIFIIVQVHPIIVINSTAVWLVFINMQSYVTKDFTITYWRLHIICNDIQNKTDVW